MGPCGGISSSLTETLHTGSALPAKAVFPAATSRFPFAVNSGALALADASASAGLIMLLVFTMAFGFWGASAKQQFKPSFAKHRASGRREVADNDRK